MNGVMHSSSHKHRPELHITAETGVLEAPAGALIVDGSMHVFHQFRPRESAGSRWAHQVASEVAYDWDVCDDVVVPEGSGDGHDIDILAGSTVAIDERAAELFFVVTHPKDVSDDDALGTHITHRQRGPRTFTIHRAAIDDVSELTDVSDDPTHADPRVRRLGPIDVDDSRYAVSDLVTPCVIHRPDQTYPDQPWLMLALALEGSEDARIVVLRSADRQSWQVLGPLELPERTVRDSRPFAPRMVSMVDAATGATHDVLFITYEGVEGESKEVAGYVVGTLSGTEFNVRTPFRPIDYGHDFTRPRIIPFDNPVMFGLVGSHPSIESTWANCLSAPRYLTLSEGKLYQDILGAPSAVRAFSDYAFIWCARIKPHEGTVTVTVNGESGDPLATITYQASEVTVTRHPGGDSRSAELGPDESGSLTIFYDSPVCEVFADGGAATLTSTMPSESRVASIDVSTADGAVVESSMQSSGRQIMRSRAGLTSPEEQERFQAEALIADRDVAEGLFED